jgi:hypothetical protein
MVDACGAEMIDVVCYRWLTICLAIVSQYFNKVKGYRYQMNEVISPHHNDASNPSITSLSNDGISKHEHLSAEQQRMIVLLSNTNNDHVNAPLTITPPSSLSSSSPLSIITNGDTIMAPTSPGSPGGGSDSDDGTGSQPRKKGAGRR